MSHAERCEAVRHCRWVDEVVPDAPWIIDAEFIEKYEIDYVAHDEDPYAAVGHDDVYNYVKEQGKPPEYPIFRHSQFPAHLFQENSFQHVEPRAYRHPIY